MSESALQEFKLGDQSLFLEILTCPGPNGTTKAFVLLEDVQAAFDTTSNKLRIGRRAISFMRDDNMIQYIPLRVPCVGGDSVIEVILPGTPLPPTTSSRSASTYSTETIGSTTSSSTITFSSPSSPSSPSTVELDSTMSLSSLSLSTSQPDDDLSSSTESSAKLVRRMTRRADMELDKVGQAIAEAGRSGKALSHDQVHGLVQQSLQPLRQVSSLVLSQNNDNTTAVTTTTTTAIDDSPTAPVSLQVPGDLMDKVNKLLQEADFQRQQATLAREEALFAKEKLIKIEQQNKETHDRLVMIQSKAEAILTQNFELLEYTIPRLFIILPDETDSSMIWAGMADPANLFRQKFRLHFICECGEHTKTAGSKIPHHLHLAKHDGYVIRQPTEFFSKYGPFLRVMLEAIKMGVHISGYAVPALANLKLVTDGFQSSVDSVSSTVLNGVDKSILFLDHFSQQSLDGDNNVDQKGVIEMNDLAAYLADVQGIEGTELRQLEQYLKADNDSGNLLGNLYRMTVKGTGHVKWVCKDHYREAYQAANTSRLSDLVSATEKAGFDEQLGKLSIVLTSSLKALEFYDALNRTAQGVVLELQIRWNFNQTYSDLVAFKSMVLKSSIVNLTVYFGQDSTAGFTPIGKRRPDPILEIMKHATIQSFAFALVHLDFLDRVKISEGFQLRNLKTLELWWNLFNDGPKTTERLKQILAAASNLKTLIVGPENLREESAYNAVRELTGPFSIEINDTLTLSPSMSPRPQLDSLKDILSSVGNLDRFLERFGKKEKDVVRYDCHVSALTLAVEEYWEREKKQSQEGQKGNENDLELKELRVKATEFTAVCYRLMNVTIGKSRLEKFVLVLGGSEDWKLLRNLQMDCLVDLEITLPLGSSADLKEAIIALETIAFPSKTAFWDAPSKPVFRDGRSNQLRLPLRSTHYIPLNRLAIQDDGKVDQHFAEYLAKLILRCPRLNVLYLCIKASMDDMLQILNAVNFEELEDLTIDLRTSDEQEELRVCEVVATKAKKLETFTMFVIPQDRPGSTPSHRRLLNGTRVDE